MIIDQFNHTIDHWLDALPTYTDNSFTKQPSPTSWSVAQLYNHLIDETKWYLGEIEKCLSSESFSPGEMTSDGKKMFAANEFPDIMIKGNSQLSNNLSIIERNQLHAQLTAIKHQVNTFWQQIDHTNARGQTPYPGLGYFNAKDWIKFADMHLRHHLRQKKRIDDFLSTER